MTDDEQKKIFSRNLNYQLSKLNITQKDVADKIGVSPQTFNTWSKGIAIPRMGKVQRLADYFGINKSDLIDDKSADESNKTDVQVLQEDEKYLLIEYRKLDQPGKNTVNAVLQSQLDRIGMHQKKIVEPKYGENQNTSSIYHFEVDPCTLTVAEEQAEYECKKLDFDTIEPLLFPDDKK